MGSSTNKTKRFKALRSAETVVKTLLFDVECSPNVGFTWGRWEQNVIEFLKEKQIISIAYQWYPAPEIHVIALPDFRGYKPDTLLSVLGDGESKNTNGALMKAFHKVISKADIAIGHNIDSFDDKLVNTDFIVNKLTPIPPHKTVDTLKVARARFAFQGNRLGDLGARLGLGKKVRHWGFRLWRRCMAGDPKAWNLMRRYNAGDIKLLRRVYEKMRPWMLNHPNMTVLDGRMGCPTCRGTRMQRRGRRLTKSGWSISFQCQTAGCRRWMTAIIVNGQLRFK